MAWWTLANGIDEIGDQAADRIESALDALTAPDARPTPAQLMQALAEALRAYSPQTEGIEVRTSDGTTMVFAACAAPDAGGLQQRLEQAINDLHACYVRYLDRAPSPSEICAVFAFVLRHEPSDFLSDASAWRPRGISPVNRPNGHTPASARAS
jgi:hypothetical protein